MRLRQTSAVITITLLAVALFLAWFLLLRPAFLGGPATYVMVRGESMEPTLHSGDLAVARKQDSYGNGDVVAFRVPEGEPGEGGIVIHRIVGGTAEDGFVMQGDNKDAPDSWRPTADDIMGRLWFGIPGGEQFILRLRQPLIVGLLAGGLGVFLILDSGQKPKRPRQEKPPDQPSPAAPSGAVTSGARRRFRPPPGLTLWLLLALMATAGVVLVFTVRH